MSYIDAFELLPCDTITVLQKGFVKLVECNPRYALKERKSIEHVIVQFARTSTQASLKSIEADNDLIKYLYENKHTSPFEAVEFTFLIRCPLFVAVHFIRHRTASINQQSARYSKIKDDFYTPSTMTLSDVYGGGIRMQSTTNKQSSDQTMINDDVLDIFHKMESMTEQLYVLYEDAINKGIAHEVARFCLPQSVFTEFHYKMDLNNLLKMLSLRCDKSAQAETRVVADAILELVKNLIPITYECHKNDVNGLKITSLELEAIKNKIIPYSTTKKRKREAFISKVKDLGIDIKEFKI
jgi:thymidylate synthase (FAD)